MIPETKYARSGDINIAYQVIGEGNIDLVYVPGWVSNVEYNWEEPHLKRFLLRLASFSRLIIFDKRGTGLSDPAPELPTLEKRMDDVRAVMDAVESRRAVLLGVSEGGTMCALFAATYPERTRGIILYGSYAKRIWSPDYPWGPTHAERQKFFDLINEGWGGEVDAETLAPSMANDKSFKQWWATYLRRSASPSMAIALAKMNTDIDIRNILPTIHVPTLILHRTGDIDMPVGGSRYMAEHIPNAKYVELPGDDHLWFVGDANAVLNNIEEFITGSYNVAEPERILATVMFTDIVGSTEKAAEIGDAKWKDLLTNHYKIIREELTHFKGKEIDTTGDGLFATFDGPARAIRCAMATNDAVRRLGIQIRIGLHTGECELMENKVSGIAVHLGARVMSKAGPNEVLVSSTVKDLVAGSGIAFEERGMHKLKGIPGEWQLFKVLNAEGS